MKKKMTTTSTSSTLVVASWLCRFLLVLDISAAFQVTTIPSASSSSPSSSSSLISSSGLSPPLPRPRPRTQQSLLAGALPAAAGRIGRSSPTALRETNKKSGLDESLRTKLLSETIAPWRAVRLFLYFALGSGAFIGGLITFSAVIATLSGAGPVAGAPGAVPGAEEAVDVNAQYTNLAIDFGGVVGFALLAKFDLDKQRELDDRVVQRVEEKKEKKKVVKAMKEREQQLGTLSLRVQVSADGSQTRDVPVRELQAGARQHMIVVIGPKKACRDALVGANLLKMDFAMSNVLVVPYETDKDPAAPSTGDAAAGFGDRPAYETQPYVARPAGDGWEEYVKGEMNDAVTQSGPGVKKEGIAIVVASTGKVVRRGVGKVPWRQMVEELQQTTPQ